MEETLKFSEMNLSEEIQSAIRDMGFENASPIQTSAIPFILEGRDLIGQAQTGTGKTAAFAIPTLELINADVKKVQALVMCPTRELAIQVSDEFKKLGKYKKGIKTLPIYGGESIDRQITILRQGVQIIIGTPGRIMDHLDRGTLVLKDVQLVILDEADEMLNMGFIEDIESILTTVPDNRQTVFFSATMPKPILELTKKFQKNPEIIKVTKKELTVSNIEQFYYEIKNSARIETISRLVDMYNLKLMLIFCNTKRGVDELVEELQVRNLQAEGLHGDLRQTQRNNVLAKFKNGIITILVATDVAARGIDVDNVEAVFNFDIPLDEENYVHRIGRTGRAGRTGKSFTFVTNKKDSLKLREIQNYTKAPIQKGEVPSSAEIAEFKKNQFFEKVTNTMYADELKEFNDMADEFLHSGLSPKSIIAALLKLNLGHLEKQYKDEDFKMSFERRPDSNTERPSGRRERKFNVDSAKMVKIFINVGKNQRIRPGDIVGALAGEAKIDGKLIGDIEIKDKFSFVYVPKEIATKVMTAMEDNTIKGNKVNLEIAN